MSPTLSPKPDFATPATKETSMLPNVDQEKLIVTQANELAFSAQKLSIQEKRLAFLLMALVRRNDEDFKTYYVPVTSVLEYLEIQTSKSLYGRLRSICHRFMTRVLDFDDHQGGWSQIHWVDRCRLLTGTNKENPLNVACLELQLHADLKPLLLNLKERYGSITFRQLALMGRFTSMRLAEILFHASYGLRKNKKYYELDDLKFRLGLKGRYKNFYSFKKEVLIAGQKECKERGPITFTWETETKGKRVIGLWFFITENRVALPPAPPITEARENPQLSLPIPRNKQELTPDQRLADQALEENGVDSVGRGRLLEDYDPDRILENARIALEKFEAGKIENLPAGTVAAVKNDYRKKASPYEKAQEAKKQKAAKERKAQEEAKKKADDLIASLLKEFESQQKEIIRKIFEALPEQEKDRELNIFEIKTEGLPTGRIFANVENKHAIFDQKKSGLKFAEHSIITGTLRIHLLDRFKHEMTPEQAKFTIWAKTKGHEIEGGMSSGYRIIKKTQNS